MLTSRPVRIVLFTILFLFFFQLIADFIEATYVFGLMGGAIPPEIVFVLLLFSPAVLLILRKGLAGWSLIVVGVLMMMARAAEVLLDTRLRMITAGVGVGCFMLILPSLLVLRGERGEEGRGAELGSGLTAGLALSILFRVLGSGSDATTNLWTPLVGWVLAMVGAALMVNAWMPSPRAETPPESAPKKTGWWSKAGLALGVVSALMLLYFSFSAPNVIARWTGANYLVIVAAVALVLAAFAIVLSWRPALLTGLSAGAILIWNLLFALALTLTIVAHQISFPAEPAGYPLAEPAVTFLHHVPLFFTLLLFPVILVDFILLCQELVERRPSSRSLGGAFTLVNLFFLVMILGHIFTTVYDYVPGGSFRDRFWLVYLVAGVSLALPVLLARRGALGRALAAGPRPIFGALVTLIALAAIVGVVLTAASPDEPAAGDRTLRILTYNILQGNDAEGIRNYDGQLALIQAEAPDIVGLQESDTNRIAGGNGDVARYMADRLDMHSYYGPKTVPGTFGVALLSRYPIQNPRTFYMFSEGEQTATIAAQITVDGQTFNVFVTHLGNGGPIVQQEAILSDVAGVENLILMGDFNFRPDTEQYRLTTEMLDDSWVLAGVGTEVENRIDHIFVSPGTQVVETRYLESPESDHPAMVTEITW
jgi:endonuclease/exonuclease/phosphatase family metal-dependent hydrolase